MRKLIKILVTLVLVAAHAPMVGAAQSRSANDDLQDFLAIQEPWKGDLDGMHARRHIRVLVVHNPMFYFLDKGTQRGTTYEAMKLFEKQINKNIKRKHLLTHIVFIPVPRDQLIPALLAGRGDIASANLTITPERKKLVDFSDPVLTNVKELLVTGPKSPPVKSIADLSGKTVYVRKSSSYYESLKALNARFKKEGKAPVMLVFADESLEDHDLIEMIDAGILPAMVIDDHKADFWKGIFKKIKVHDNIVLRSGGKIAVAFRKSSPQLKAELNKFVKNNKAGTLMGNILLKRYLQTNKWVKNNLNTKDRERFDSMVDIFEKYSQQYGFDYLMIAAQGYQESGLDQSKRSQAGAIGVMQLLPSTASDPNVGIQDITELDNNVHAGTKYLRFLRDRYFDDPKIDDLNQTLFTFAAYNAGPARVVGLRKEAQRSGLDPNQWFNNVEVVAARRIGRETVQYVANIFKYYVAYGLIVRDQQRTLGARKGLHKR